jgi:hypothetical protein
MDPSQIEDNFQRPGMNEWPDVVYEDVLDAEIVRPVVEFRAGTEVWGSAASWQVFMDGELIAEG